MKSEGMIFVYTKKGVVQHTRVARLPELAFSFLFLTTKKVVRLHQNGLHV